MAFHGQKVIPTQKRFQQDQTEWIQYNYKMPMDSLGGKTPSEIFLSGDDTFTPEGAEIVTPYEKDGELRMKFTDRDGNPARVSMPLIPQES